MEASASSQSPQTQATEGASRGQRHRRPRSGRGNNADASLSLRPSSVAPGSQLPMASLSDAQDSPGEPVRSNDSSRRGRGRGRAGRSEQTRTVNGRQFGGHLTRQDTNSSTQSGPVNQFQAEAPVFVPGQQRAQKIGQIQRPPPKQQPLQQKRRPSKSQAPDVANRTHEDIDNGHYECPICTSEVLRNSKVWSCHTCWTVFHLACIKKWSANEGSATVQQQAQNGDVPPPRQWRCPGCNLPKDEVPKTYSCWCEKEIDPRPLAGLPPHSCGNTCGKERARKCPHPCQLTCHAGPCPPCTHMGTTQVCFCSKHEVTKRCSETNYDSGWSCGEPCEEMMPCGEHECRAVCHPGLCGACEVRVPARCYCGHDEKDVLCDDRGDEQESYQTHLADGAEHLMEQWTGSFECTNGCERLLDCGVHTCDQGCHVQSVEPGHCPQSPDVVTHCPCGKTPLNELTETKRESCTDPIPHCKQTCNKTLPCGHQDEQVCHSGNCMPCMKTVEIRCRCARTTSRTICHQGKEEPPQCARTCRATLNCGRHACDERCCPGERKAAERQSIKRKQRPLNTASRPIDDGVEAEHICFRQCGRLLKCGSHVCEELCHKGPCGTCREAIFEEISCHCGRTVLQPPLPCGTKTPPCRYPCSRPKTCGHPQVAHNCHQDDECCPKCPFLVEKRCMCGKKMLKNQQCWLQDVSCGQPCGKKLKCGSHACRKLCHAPGECEDAHGKPCQQPCSKPKRLCGHPDIENICHAPFACKEDKPCQSKIYITCTCQAQKQETKCGSSKTSEGNGSKTLPCNEECAHLERNRKLALALNIDQSTHVDGGDHIPYSTDTLNLFAEHVKWAQTQEREFRVFATSDDERRLRFKPMPPHQRAFIHALAGDFGLDSESMDPEPHRHVMIWKTPRFVSAPSKTLAEALRIRQGQRSATGSANVSDNESTRKVNPASVSRAPYNAFVISNPRFGLTVDELRTEINALLHPDMPLTFDIEFLPNEEVVLKAVSRTLSNVNLQQMLHNIQGQVVSSVKSKDFGALELCTTDSSLHILRRESDPSAGDGWSRVAAKKAAPKIVVSGDGLIGSNSYSALGSNKVTFAKKKPEKAKPKKKELVVDDWEAAELAEEEKERATSGGSGDEEGDEPTSVGEIANDEHEAQDVAAGETTGPPTDEEVSMADDRPAEQVGVMQIRDETGQSTGA